MPQTPNHEYNVPTAGTTDWHVPLNENFEQHDTDVELRDTDANRDDYEPKPGAKFLATDRGLVSLGDGGAWTAALALARYTPASKPKDAGSVAYGHPRNDVGQDVVGATIAGGGYWDDGFKEYPNEVTADYGTVSGGRRNTASDEYATVGGGDGNTASGKAATAGGGIGNTATKFATVAGGGFNEAGEDMATIGGGANNTAAFGATVGGGYDNTASGRNSTVPGGRANTAGGDFSFAAGRGATADGNGSFVWGDSSTEGVRSTKDDEVKIQAGGGAVIFSESDHSAGVVLSSGSGSWNSWSSRSAKANVSPVDPAAVLDGVRSLDVATWNYTTQDDSIRHMGPMAEDFHETFGVGDDDETIGTVDADGVALAAIQGLATESDDRDARIEELESTVADQRREMDALTAENERLAARSDRLSDRLDALEGQLVASGAPDGSSGDSFAAD